MKNFFNTLFLLAALAVAANAAEPELDDDFSQDSTIINIEHRDRLLAIVSWPFVRIVQPTVEFLMYPVIPPLIYISRENLIEKGHNLITYGDEGQIMFYPTINAEIGGASNIGFAYRHANLLFGDDYMLFGPRLYTNADWDASVFYQKNKIMSTSFFGELGASYREMGSNDFRDPKNMTYTFADSSVNFYTALGFNLVSYWNLKFAVGYNFYRFDWPNISGEIDSSPEAEDRGFYKHFNTFPLTVSLFSNTLDEPYAPTKGSKFSIGYTYASVSPYSGSKDHNYHAVESRYVRYFLLGNKSYAMTVAESEANRERLRNLSFKEAIEILNPINVREEILERRVLVTQIKARYMLEENKGKAPFTAMGRLGDNYPLRAYPSGHFTGPLIAGISTEYRWPIDLYADALIFNEYGIFGDDFKNLPLSNLRNSYGFGFRVRTPKLFITRFALAFHGKHGVSLVLTTRPDYE
ncbi:MAG: BamA/TamA family outer membrane protein [Fibromonadaceae bacterium]|jgi:outer membrane protein assembly factor BamA|nr:BamA/TamA family outer membrane protein [Fibromonadaceae bacterium]